jgi:hypothetical protein
LTLGKPANLQTCKLCLREGKQCGGAHTHIAFLLKKRTAVRTLLNNAGLQVSQVAIPQKKQKEERNTLSSLMASHTRGYFYEKRNAASAFSKPANLQTCKL